MEHWQTFSNDVLFRAHHATQSYQAVYGLRTILDKLSADLAARIALDSGETEGPIFEHALTLPESEGLTSAALALVSVIEDHLSELHSDSGA